jgi:heavy metal translocating P-type ATPase
MIHTTHRHDEDTSTTLSRSTAVSTEKQEWVNVSPEADSWWLRLWRSLTRYPLPLSSLILLLTSLILWLVGRADLAQWVLLGVVLLGGVPLLWETLRQFLHREFSVDFIAILAIIGSLFLREYLAGAIVVLMLSGGEALEAYALRRARSSLAALAERAPRTAHMWQGEQLIDVPTEALDVGMIVVAKPGELIPVDGIVKQGNSSVSEADLTGEPVPVLKKTGMEVLSGSVNLDGVLEICASKRSSESKYAQIVRLVEEAQKHKAPIHRLADRYSVGFTAVTLALAAVAWFFSGNSVNALAVLVVATPCPLILATPIAIMSGIDLAARHGLIVKSGATIEQLGEVDTAVFDKTGTLTLGIPKVTSLVLHEQDVPTKAEAYDEETLLRLAASVEQLSSHILARAVVEAAQERNLALSLATHFEEVFGKGVQGEVPLNGENKEETCEQRPAQVTVAVGNRTFMKQQGIAIPAALLEERTRRTAKGQIVSFIAVDEIVAGLIVLEDVPRAELAQLSPDLKASGIQETILLTGDGEVVAKQIGQRARVDRVVAHCLPEEKVQVVQELLDQGHQVLMVGDGVNDAPALAAATVGIAMGTQGLTAASVAADGVLLSTDILRIVTAVRLGRHVMHIALQGIWVGMGLSTLAMILAALGYIPPAVGAILQEGIDVIVILNALRAGRMHEQHK